jgi:folate-binding protein YgfZ
MNSIWHSFQEKNNAVIENNDIIHYGNASAELKSTGSNTLIMANLSHFGIIHFSGEDASEFLQGQLSCDVTKIDHYTAQYGSCCTPKGRMLASFLVWKNSSGYFMQLPISLLITLEKRLSMYVMRAKVKLNNDSDKYVRIGVAGSLASEVVEKIFGVSPDPFLGVINCENESVICLSQDRFEIVTTQEHAPKIWENLKKYAMPVGRSCWDWLEVKEGIPVITPATQEQFVPQMTNLEAIGGISFQKGCYPGQEIVSRTQFLGKIKRRMYLANICTKESISAGDELYSAKKQVCGMVVNAAPSPEGGYDVLAVIRTDSVKNENIYWKEIKGPTLKILPLPYVLE